MLFRKWYIVLLVISLTFLMATGASALWLDLTDPSVATSGTINGAQFMLPPQHTAGTGLIDSFLRIQGKGESEAGLNTDGTREFDTKGGAFTHSLQLSDLQNNIVAIAGMDYYEFVCDVNETPGNSLITVNELQFYIDDDPDTLYADLGTPVYDLDAGGDSAVTVDYDNFAGSGKLDLYAYIPTGNFGSDLDKYVYLFSEFGPPDSKVDAGFEEWATREPKPEPPEEPPSIPEPATMLLFGTLCLFGFGLSRKRKDI
jgi:hypothetical protein